LPPKDLVAQSEAENSQQGAEYSLHSFYSRKLDPNSGLPPISNMDLLYSRIADYTFAHCK
jgi:hypothetical protein